MDSTKVIKNRTKHRDDKSYLKDSVGPCGSLQRRMYGVSSADSEQVMRCVTWKKLAMERKSFNVFPFFSFVECKYLSIGKVR